MLKNQRLKSAKLSVSFKILYDGKVKRYTMKRYFHAELKLISSKVMSIKAGGIVARGFDFANKIKYAIDSEGIWSARFGQRSYNLVWEN
jgi:hypothetical protein